jgi:hypothetical protein
MSAATNQTFDVDEFNRNVQMSIALRNLNNSMSVNNNDNLIKEKPKEEKPKEVKPKEEKPKEAKPKEDFTGFNHADFASWAKSSTGKPFNQPQINTDKQQHRPANEWFDYEAFVTWAKSPAVVQD